MESEKYLAIVLKSIDYKDNDKLVSLYTLTRGKLFAALKGVKKPTAKLKFASEQFCFGEFLVVGKGSGDSATHTITGCTPHEAFFELTLDIEKYYSGCAVLEILDAVGLFDEENKELFLSALSTLKLLAFSEVNPKVVVLRFMQSCLALSGYKESPESLPNDIRASLKLIANQPENALTNLKFSDKTLDSAMSLLHNYLAEQFGKRIRSIGTL